MIRVRAGRSAATGVGAEGLRTHAMRDRFQQDECRHMSRGTVTAPPQAGGGADIRVVGGVTLWGGGRLHNVTQADGLFFFFFLSFLLLFLLYA